MNCINRRQLLWGVCACADAILIEQKGLTCLADERPRALGCCLTGTQATRIFARASGGISNAKEATTVIPHSDDPDLDFALAQGLARISDTFDVLPGFGFYDDSDQHNAFAIDRVLAGRSDGTVLFGLNLLGELKALRDGPDLAIMAVCAHEFGHIVSYKTDIYKTLCPDPDHPFRSEQFADFMSGYFAGTRRAVNPAYQAVTFATTLYGYGGQFRGSHGTFDERGQAVQSGYDAAYKDKLKLSAAISKGFQFAMSRV
jgi:hypothetical protein